MGGRRQWLQFDARRRGNLLFASCFPSPPPINTSISITRKKFSLCRTSVWFLTFWKKRRTRAPLFFLICTFFQQSHTHEKSDVQTQRGLWTFFLFRCGQTEKNFFSLGKARTFNPLSPLLSLGVLLDRAKGIIELLFKWRGRRGKTAYIGPLCQMDRHKFLLKQYRKFFGFGKHAA